MSTGIERGRRLGTYEIKDVLGAGALGIVYCARQASLDRDVALKVLAPALASDTELVVRFEREARTAASLRHPHIVTIYDTGEADGCHYIAMELLPGYTLDKLPVPLDAGHAAAVIAQLAEALAYAHRQGVVHRDLKPENAIIDDRQHVTLTDFGVARVVGQANLTLGGGPIGTPEFMSPEQARGESADARSDVYSLGILFYFLLTGESPFRAENVLATMYRQIHDELPPLPECTPLPLQQWIGHCSSKDPAGRYANGQEALVALKSALAATPAEDLGPDPLDAVLRGDLTLEQALTVHSEREDEIRSAFSREVAALALDVVRSSQLKVPGKTILASFTFGSLRRFVQEKLDHSQCLASAWSGDGLMAIFSSTDDAAAAAAATLSGLSHFNATHSGLTEPVRVRIGLDSGRVLMSDTQKIGEITSPTLDRAGHLQKLAAPDRLVMSEAAHQLLTHKAGYLPLDPGGRLPGPVYGASDALAPVDTSAPGFSAGASIPSGEDPLFGPGAPGSLHPGSSVAMPTLIRTVAGASGLPVSRPTPLPQSAAPAGSALQPAPTPLLPVWAPLGWGALLTSATLLCIPRPPDFAVFVWLACLITAALQKGVRGPLRMLAVVLSIIGMVAGLAPNPVSGPLILNMMFGIALAISGALLGARSNRLERRRRYLVLEIAGNASLSSAGREQLLNALVAPALSLGYRERELGIRVTVDLQGERLDLTAQAVDRDAESEVASAEVQGSAIDADGLAADLGRRLARQIKAPPTAKPLPPGS